MNIKEFSNTDLKILKQEVNEFVDSLEIEFMPGIPFNINISYSEYKNLKGKVYNAKVFYTSKVKPTVK